MQRKSLFDRMNEYCIQKQEDVIQNANEVTCINIVTDNQKLILIILQIDGIFCAKSVRLINLKGKIIAIIKYNGMMND